MTITAKVVADSISEAGIRITTMELRYPRFIHAEFMTHRVFSRNASSSRAIPIEKMIQDVIDDPATPVAWGSNKPGMQAGDECHAKVGTGDYTGFSRVEAWIFARDNAVDVARGFAKAGYHKQIANRLLEPFGHISVIVTATEWQNFFDLRCHPDADPTMRALADAIREARYESKPEDHDWHLPYLSEKEQWDIALGLPCSDQWNFLAMVSAARCARVSYLNHDGTQPDIEKDLALAKRLLDSKHMSPFEHQAQVAERSPDGWFYEHLQGNFTGWNQHRKFLELKQ